MKQEDKDFCNKLWEDNKLIPFLTSDEEDKAYNIMLSFFKEKRLPFDTDEEVENTIEVFVKELKR